MWWAFTETIYCIWFSINAMQWNNLSHRKLSHYSAQFLVKKLFSSNFEQLFIKTNPLNLVSNKRLLYILKTSSQINSLTELLRSLNLFWRNVTWTNEIFSPMLLETSTTSFWCFCCQLSTYFTPFSSVSIVEFG